MGMAAELQWLEILASGTLIVMLLGAAIVDVMTHRIPNALIGPALVVALTVAAITAGGHGLLLAVSGLGVGLAMLLPLYILGGMGAGDVKLLGISGAFLGPVGALIAGLATIIVGGVLGVLYIGWRRLRRGSEHQPAAASSGDGAMAVTPAFNALATQFPGLAVKLSTVLPAPGAAGTVAARETARKNSTFAYAPAIGIGVAFLVWQQGWAALIGIG
jgi:prepilin peptidase CpaA